MFNISIEDTFENREEEFNSFPPIGIWEDLPDGAIQIVTDIRQTSAGFWLSCREVGAIEIKCEDRQILAYPTKEVTPDRFDYYLTHAWLPLAYQACGAQVIHASAVVHIESQRVIVFSGESGSGKSTLAFAFGKQDNWRQIADDRLAFEIIDGRVEPRFIPDTIKLRQPSAEHFQHKAFSFEEIDWFVTEMKLDAIFIVEQLPPNQEGETLPFSIHPLSKADAYTKILKNAVSLSPSLRELNKDLIQDYLVLVDQVKTYALSYTPTFEILNELIPLLEADLIR